MASDIFSVEGRSVLVVGASRGIGRTLAAGFAQRGASVFISGRVAETLNSTALALSADAGSVVTPVVCDVCHPEAVTALVNAVLARAGRIDTLINVAGVSHRMPAESLTVQDFDQVIGTNLRGAFLVSSAVGRHMLENGGGSQINICSLLSDRPMVGLLPYAAGKAGLAQMTRALAIEWGGRGVRVNGIAPGFIVTEMTRKALGRPDVERWATTSTPLRRLGRPDDLVGVAVFLASEAAAFVTGQILVVDGGFSSGFPWPAPPGPTSAEMAS